MPREIKKKILDKEIDGVESDQSPEDQAESLWESGQLDERAVPSQGRIPASLDANPSGGEKKIDSGYDFSLDDFDFPQASEEEEATDAPSLDGETDEDAASPEASKKAGKFGIPRAAVKKLTVLAVSLTLIVALGAIGVKRWGAKTPTKKRIIVPIKHAIEIPRLKEKLDFFLFAHSQTEANLLNLSLEMEFQNLDRHKRFLDDNVLLRNMIYDYLDSRRPSKNSMKEWNGIVERDLAAYLKNSFPQSRADFIRVSRLEKL